MKVTVYWVTNNYDLIHRIQAKFGLPRYMTLNGETECEITEKTLTELRKGEPEYLIIRRIETHNNEIIKDKSN